ncbi:proline-rich receptor-like protein kinase PERK9 [Iris pallida]|uniref:Proline-rich receptor-like protein kinase PERK9 n=1 Tax=Iris pallida TaxID=29817 RepID=A0AAX6HTL0_IRIPA|nr:proline-rich receptor-like protein kinase PERK9 [Iris pallida]
MVMVFVELGMSMVLKGVVAGCCLRSGQSGGMDGSWCGGVRGDGFAGGLTVLTRRRSR